MSSHYWEDEMDGTHAGHNSDVEYERAIGWGGQREGAGPPREMVESVRATITLEKSHLKQLKAKHGRKWQKVIRFLIETHLHGT